MALPPTLLSRFDLIYLILDTPNPVTDRKLAKHLVAMYFEHPPVRDTSTILPIEQVRSPFCSVLASLQSCTLGLRGEGSEVRVQR